MTHTDVVTHTDISGESWVDRLPQPLVPYFKLMRLDRPIGVWLLLFPGWWSIVLAGGITEWRLLALFALGSVIMRGAGCTINDLWDRELDNKVERTRPRPLAAGTISVPQARAFLFFQLALGLAILLQMNTPTIALGFISLIPITIYPLMKRITWWPQLFLGITFNWSALMGWTAVTGKIDMPALLLYAGCIFWTLGYDTIYAHQDKEDDLRIGIKSTAIRFGQNTKPYLTGFYSLAILLFGVTLFTAQIPIWVCALLTFPALQLAWQVKTLNTDKPENCLQRFKSNRWVGWSVLIAFAIASLA